jgi:BirA family transcriptional regulator, biotin operon repressor / biotin---[acetyl-CoA-carboxylase] ligase
VNESVPAARWEGATAEVLANRWGLPAVHLYARIGSTNDAARALALAGAPHGTVVLAEEQTAGRGRGGRAWSSAAGMGIWMSLVARPAALPAPGLAPILVGLAAADALDVYVRPAMTQVKWPNDLWIGGRKFAGILCEALWERAGTGSVVAGIGINVLHAPDDFPPEVRTTATSIRIAAGWSPPRAEVAGAVAAAVARALSRAPEHLSGASLDALRRRDPLEGRSVHVSGAESLTGTAIGVNPAGALLVRTGDGRLRAVTAGSVRLAG